jgi:hypothetical protein
VHTIAQQCYDESCTVENKFEIMHTRELVQYGAEHIMEFS